MDFDEICNIRGNLIILLNLKPKIRLKFQESQIRNPERVQKGEQIQVLHLCVGFTTVPILV